jgi:soluble lytic murein transglycosylase-like protein
VIMQDAITLSTNCGSSPHTLFFPYRDSLKHAECSQGKCHIRTWAGQIVRLRSRGAIARIIVLIAPFVYQMATSTAFEVSARTQTATRYETIDRFDGFIAAASTRFAVPATWIRAVMQVESGGDARATSPRGAMGLMQLMPGTLVWLSVRYGLGLDPFDASENILAGTAYLKEMHDRFGSAGFLVLRGTNSTSQQVNHFRPKLSRLHRGGHAIARRRADEHAAVDGRRALPWREAPLFVERARAP